jgi:uncharacterized protein (DUF885 family)
LALIHKRWHNPALWCGEAAAMNSMSKAIQTGFLSLALSLALSLGTLADADASADEAALAQLFQDERQASWQFDPISATTEGIVSDSQRLPSVTPLAQKHWLETNEKLLHRLHAIAKTPLAEQAQINYELFDFMLSQRLRLGQYREWRAPFNSDSGFFSELLYLHESAPLRTRQDYENFIARLNDFPRYFAEQTANMRAGLKDGFTVPKAVLNGVEKVLAAAQFAKAQDCPLYQAFATFPSTISSSDQTQLRALGIKALQEQVLPSYAQFQQFFRREYQVKARATIAAQALPNGKNYYRDLVRFYTTLPNADANQIHQIGLDEVKRIHTQMLAIMAELKFKGDFAQFLTFLRTDPQFYATTPDALLKDAAFIAKSIDGQLLKFFRTLPRTPYGVRAVPETLAPNYTAGRYNPGPMGGAGEYWVNTFALTTRPLYSLPALTLHEAVPGHHLQGALARELQNVPQFRRNFYPHAFGEGWALYAEKLGVEMGIYQTPYEHFGRLSYEMWRACRLVVDTGMHAKGWTRAQANAYLKENTALSTHEIRTEVDRYISWPGQALAYKMGELKFLELRAKATAALGEKFDIRDFHDALLRNGGVTLPLLEQQVARYIQAQNE